MNTTATYHPIEQGLRNALSLLYKLSREQGSNSEQGLSVSDKRSSFLLSCINRTYPLTGGQLNSLYGVLAKYTTQLAAHNIVLPDEAAVKELATKRIEARISVDTPTNNASASAANDDKAAIDIIGGMIYLKIASGRDFRTQKARFDEFRQFISGEKFYAWAKYDSMTKLWRMPLSEPVFLLLISNKYFPTSFTRLSDNAQKYKAAIDARELAAIQQKTAISAKEEQEYQLRLQAIGGLDAEFARGKKLYKHQRQALEVLLRRTRFIIADETGLGKTAEGALAAKSMQQAFGLRIYIVTTKSSMGMWRKTCVEIGISAEVFGWGELLTMKLDDEDFPFPYVLIVDEGHYACNLESKRTKKYLEFANLSNCKGVYTLTGTPMPNGRPVNQYPLLLAAHHSLVWDESPLQVKKKKSSYLKRFCGAFDRYIGSGKTILDVSGATNLAVLNGYTMYVPERETNHPDACVIARLKIDCTDLPAKERFMDIVELTSDALKIYKEEVDKAWQGYRTRVEEKLKVHRQELIEQGFRGDELEERMERYAEQMKRAEALVSCGILRHAGAVAKIDTVVERANIILDRGSKLTIFTSFVDVAKELRLRIAAENPGINIGIISGETPEQERNDIVDSFQSDSPYIPNLRVVIFTAAGSEAITLTGTPNDPCQFMMVVDRLWTPGKMKQAEDRIHRLGTTGTVTIYWMQLPEEVSPMDVKVDGIIQQKQINIDLAQFGKVSTGVEFVNDEELNFFAKGILKESYERVHSKRKKKVA